MAEIKQTSLENLNEKPASLEKNVETKQPVDIATTGKATSIEKLDPSLDKDKEPAHPALPGDQELKPTEKELDEITIKDKDRDIGIQNKEEEPKKAIVEEVEEVKEDEPTKRKASDAAEEEPLLKKEKVTEAPVEATKTDQS